MKIEVVNLNETEIDESSSDYVYVGRGSPLGNPWSHKKSKYKVRLVDTREEAVEKYRDWIEKRLSSLTVQYSAVEECVKILLSTGHLTLGCFCAPLPCHGHVLAEVILNKARQRAEFFEELF